MKLIHLHFDARTRETHRRVLVEAGHASHVVYYPKERQLEPLEFEIEWRDPDSPGWHYAGPWPPR